MKSLKELQETFQRGILAGDDAILAEVKDSAKEKRNVLFGVYRNAYVARLAEILGDDYEQLHSYLGDQGFARLVKAYIAPIRQTSGARGGSGVTFPPSSGKARPTPSIERPPNSPNWRRPSPMPSTGLTPSRLA
ncbi:MAG: hypothetical protein A2W02_00115 [Alphaproteobacteria bacterium RBG_16_64_48]|nr:MAG: hypothetical protein A2W02_00115 [Alphaproteobacteria bacterium RBG_16_64_48]